MSRFLPVMKANILMAMLVAAVTAVQAELTPSQIAKKAFPSTVLLNFRILDQASSGTDVLDF